MTAPTEHRLSEPIGPGRTVIEASAGTGKTYAISAIVAGLVAGEGVPLEEILVVTFTRAATAELRSRVRSRLRDTLRAVADPATPEGDDRLAFLGGGADRSVAAARLAEALTHFDRAQIFTIDGFARRLLGQLGLRARLPVDVEASPVDDLVVLQTASDLVIGRFTADATDVVPTGDVATIGKKVVETADARIVPDAAGLGGEALARVELAHAMRREVRRRMRMAGLAGFDDTLEEVRDALADPEVGPSARALLQRRYTVALVDESQDTDPIQWQVIRSVFDDARLVVIGDPKQSIYSFRGADVESYLSAVEGPRAADPVHQLAQRRPPHRRPRRPLRRRHLRRRPHRLPRRPSRPRPRDRPHPRDRGAAVDPPLRGRHRHRLPAPRRVLPRRPGP
jgi:exodeoxyribonuclease V beta subunit